MKGEFELLIQLFVCLFFFIYSKKYKDVIFWLLARSDADVKTFEFKISEKNIYISITAMPFAGVKIRRVSGEKTYRRGHRYSVNIVYVNVTFRVATALC